MSTSLRTAVAAVAIAAVGLVVPAAHAGTYNVEFNDGQGCGLFTAGPTSGYLVKACDDGVPDGPLIVQGSPGLQQVPEGSAASMTTTAPAGITISGVVSDIAQSGPVGSGGWYDGDSYTGGGSTWTGLSGQQYDNDISTSSWGFLLGCSTGVSACGPSPPGVSPEVIVNSITFTGSETQAPAITSAGANDLFDETGGYVWNPAGDPWTIPVSSSDPSGTCNISAIINGQSQIVESQTPNQYVWKQCADGSWSTTVDTRQFVPAAGKLPLTLQATNAARNTDSITQSINVDNEPVSESLATPNDSNPTVWVNHPVQVTATGSAGPSGISGQSCSVDGAASFAYPQGGFAVDGDGTHTVSCTAANGAVDPQGAPNTGSASQTVAIDEAPPAVAFEPVDPADPDHIAVDTADSESGVASASLTVQGPHATAPTPVASTLSGGQLTADYDDAGKHGPYTFVATSCDQVGNCASSSETLQFPIRLGTSQQLSFKRIVVPAKTVRKTVVLGGHGKTITRREKIDGHFKPVKLTILVGAHKRHVRVHIKTGKRCGEHTIRYHAHGKKHHRRVRACRKTMSPRVVGNARRQLGRKVKLYGRVLTAQGAPIAGMPVQISARPRYAQGTWKVLRTVNTGPKGYWTAKLDGGPSRLIRAHYIGSTSTEPATETVRLTVPAKIRLSITPHVLPWSHTMRFKGHLVGSYIPHDGLALRLLVHYPHAKQWTVLRALRTNQYGAFHFKLSYNAGRGVATYPFKIATTATESDYPYAPGSSRPVKITFGRATPHHHAQHRTHRARHHHRRRHRAHRHRGGGQR